MSNEEKKSAGLWAWLAFGVMPLFVALVLGFYKNVHPQISKVEQEEILAPVGKVVAKETEAKGEAKAADGAKADDKKEDKKEDKKDDAKAADAKAEEKSDAKPEAKPEAKAEEAKPEAAKAEEPKAEDAKPEAKGEDSKAEDKAATGASCKVTVEANDQMQFNLNEITIDKGACPEFTVEIKHVGSMDKASMGHNVVISKEADKDAVVNEGIDAGIDKDFVKEGDSRVLAHTKLIGGGETAEVKFKTDGFEVGGGYDFFCTYPGHAAMMTGKVIVTGGDGAKKADGAAAAADNKDDAKPEAKPEAKAEEPKAEDKAAGGSCKATVEADDQMQFNLNEITIDKAACPEFTVEIKHVGSMDKSTMGHNVVISKEADKDAVVNEGIDAGIDKDFVKEGDSRVLAHTKLIGGGETAEVKFKTDGFEVGGGYDFFCTYPGHAAMMTGKVVVK